MRRFLDWTAAQAVGDEQSNASTIKSSPQPNTSTLSQPHSMQPNTIKDLEIQHLMKLLHEIKYYQASSSPLPSAINSQNQRDFVEKIHKTLPLFLNVFGTNTVQALATGSSFAQLDSSFISTLDSLNSQAGRSTSQSSLSIDDVREGSQSESCSTSKPSSPLPPRSPPMDKFPDLMPFAFTIARMFVSEVRQRASDKHAEDASFAILQFLNARQPNNLGQTNRVSSSDKNIHLSQERASNQLQLQSDSQSKSTDGKGWNLLLSLNTLASSQNSQIIQLLCDASLPSTLIKCLYLFYDLPVSMKCKNSAVSVTFTSSSFEATKGSNDNKSNQTDDVFLTRDLTSNALIKAFTQLLVQLCSYQSAIDELIRKEDLRLILGIASSQCSAQNKSWRKTAFHTLLAISKTMRDNFMYLEQNPCIQVYVDNINRISSLGLAGIEDVIEMIGVLIEFVYNLDVNNRNQPKYIAPIIEQLKSSRLVETIEELLFKIDDSIAQELNQFPMNSTSSDMDLVNCPMSQQPSVSSEIGVCVDDYRRFGRRLIQTLVRMSKINYHQEAMTKYLSLKPLAMSRFEMLAQFKMPKPSAKGSVLNTEALRLFKLIWSKCKDFHLIDAALDATISLFNDDKYNYFIFESEQLLVYYMSSPNFNLLPCKLRQKLFKFLEFIVIETNYIPCLELGTLGAILTSTNTTDYDRILILRTLIACLRFSLKFSDIFRDIGLLEVIINLLNETMQIENLSQLPEKLEILYLLLESSQYMLAGSNNLNCTQFNESGAARQVFNCLSKPKYFHLFVPQHSSSSDDGGPASRNSTPTPTGLGRAPGQRQAQRSMHASHHLTDLNMNRQQQGRPSIKQMQKVAFAIIRQIILSGAGDEHLANLLVLLARTIDDLRTLEAQDDTKAQAENSKSTRDDLTFLISQEVNLKIYILKSLMIILKDNHRCRALFRKVGGFVYLVSALVALEKALPLCEPADNLAMENHKRWLVVNSRRIWRLIKNVLMTIIVAMRSEPANLGVFVDDTMPKFTEAIKKLGCFCTNSAKFQRLSRAPPKLGDFESFRSIFLSPPARDLSTSGDEGIQPTQACCQLFRFLYDMSLDMADGTSELEEQLSEESGKIFNAPHHSRHNHDSKSLSFDQSSTEAGPGIYRRRPHFQQTSVRPPSLDLKACSPEPAILTFPSIILCMLDLIPYCPVEELMTFACLVIKSLFKHERNHQLLCEAGLIAKLLNSEWQLTLKSRGHFLHNLSEFMFEKLTNQAITPLELRSFLRLDDPLCCKSLDDIELQEDADGLNSEQGESKNLSKQKEKIATCRIETLVNMMTSERSSCQPPFVEFDLNGSGSSYIFMPSIAPINAKSMPQNLSYFLNSTLDVHTTEKNGILGGVGSTERSFPPANGLTFSSWICIEQFPSRCSDHNIRLLTIYRGSAATGKEYSCLRVQISALDRALTVSTQESLLFDSENRPDNQADPECFVRVWTPETLVEGQWHHIVVTLSKSSQKQSGIYIYIDGQLIHNQRICYISNYVGPTNYGPLGAGTSASTCSPAAFVNAFIGSLPQIRLKTKTLWKQGPCHLLEEQIGSNFVSAIYARGPSYIGNFQSKLKNGESSKHKSTKHSSSYVGGDHLNHPPRGPLVHQSASSAQQSSPRHAFPLSRVSSSGMSSHAPIHQSHTGGASLYQINEDKVLISLDARSTSYMSLTRMRRIYTRFDCRQVTRFLGLSSQESSTNLLLLHNTAVHLNGPSRGVGALTIGYDHVRCFIPSPTEQTLFQIGGSYILIGLVAQAQSTEALLVSFKALTYALISNPKLQAQMENINGFQLLTVMLWKKKHLLDQNILNLLFAMVKCDRKLCSRLTNGKTSTSRSIVQVAALRELICECFDLWLQTNMINSVLEFIYELISSTPTEQYNDANSINIRTKNLKYLRDMDILPRMLRLLPRDPTLNISDDMSTKDQTQDSCLIGNIETSGQTFDAKAIYLIKQTVFELLNRTPRQSDILYFGQFLTSLLPSSTNERSEQTINLRNVLSKSLLQMMTRNKQSEVNYAMQEELVRILGFDWFMLFISGPHLNNETITIGFLNLMILLSNKEIYMNFKNKSTPNGGWLKEPTFPTIDGKFNIQLLGINVGVFSGLSAKGGAICQDILEAANFCLLNACLSNLKMMPHIYLMVFQTMMGRLSQLDVTILDSIGTFEKLNLDLLCDCLIGETHHKRRQTLAGIQFKNLELVVSLTYMIGDIMSQYSEQQEKSETMNDSEIRMTSGNDGIPTEIVKFFMYLYNNNQEFQNYCRRSDDIIDALSDALMISPNDQHNSSQEGRMKSMTRHPAAKEVLELSRLIVLDRMTEVTTVDSNEFGTYDQLRTFERFLEALSSCKEAQGQLIDMLLRQILLIIDSTSRHNSTKTINNAENYQQFRLLLINSILVSQIVVDKIWSQEIFAENHGQISIIINHQLCLAEQIFKFNEILPKSNPPLAFVMQHTLNRILLYALSLPTMHMSDKLFMLDLLKKIYDNRTIIILNHMHSPQSAEFFVCATYCLLNIIEENVTTPSRRITSHQSMATDQPSSLIERQYGHPTGVGSSTPQRGSPITESSSSTSLMLVSMARKVWDAIYQSKRGILSEAFEVPLSLPAFTLDTSLDLIQLKPDIIDSCGKFWSSLLETEHKPKRRLQAKQNDPAQGATSAAVNIISGRLTRVVNAASFVSRVVGATAGSMASNVNLVGERLSQTSRPAVSRAQRSPSDLTSGSFSHRTSTGAADMSAATSAGHSQSQQSQQAQQQQSQQVMSLTTNQIYFKHSKLTQAQICAAMKTHISIIDEYIKLQLSQKNHKLELHKYLCDEWLDAEAEVLLRERALFGPEHESKLAKWCLDLTEGPRRMRKKMVNNTKQFFSNYSYCPEQFNPDNKSLRYRPPMSFDSRLYYLKTLNQDKQLFVDITNNELKTDTEKDNENKRVNGNGEIDQSDENDNGRATPTVSGKQDNPTVAISSTDSPNKKKLYEFHSSSLESISSALRFQSNSPKLGEGGDADQDDGDSTSFVDFSPEIEAEANSARESENSVDSLSVLRLLEKNERISHMFRCSRVQGLDTHEGLLLFGREHFYLIDGFTLLKTREIKDIDSLPPDAHDPIIPNSTPNVMAHSKKTCSKFAYDGVMEVHKRRYLLQPIALEIFSSDGRNALIVFPRNIRNKVHSRFTAVANQTTSNAQESLAGQKSNVSVEGGSGLLSNLMGETSVTQRWVRGELSNFQYLMNLNTIAGRSYNDLMQYPIFPWILADYVSDHLDLNKASTFRDLSRPIGAQTSDRLDQFKRRYSEWDDTETPPYHYGTFYSSAMIVASYMVRMEPFTQHFLRLQGGHFDLADRMFHSINDSWLSASKHNMADIRELIPEFFYLPEFLRNENKYDLGIKQNGMRLDDVILPPWAKNDAREFIRLHRCALESDYVSAHLHEWIDLIFGYKQQGQAAVDAVNVFHHLFYEGNVDIYNTDIDPIKKNAVIGFINNFGQIPKQLFKKPHPVRKITGSSNLSGGPPMPLTPILPTLSANSTAGQRILTHCPQMLRLTNTTFKDLRGPVGQIVQVDKNIVAVEQNKLLIPPEYCRYIAWGHADRSLRLGLYESEKPIFVWEGSDNQLPYEILSSTIPNNRMMITAGTDSVITVWKIENMRTFMPITNLYGHVEPVTCLASSQAYSLIVSGSRDRTAIIWDLNRLTFVRQLGAASSNGELVHRGPISAIAINDSTGDIATCATSWLYLWSINGELLAQVDTFSVALHQSMMDPNAGASSVSSNLNQLHILSVCFSQHNEWDLDEVILTGSSDGSVAFWSMRYYQSAMTDEEIEAAAKKEADRYVEVNCEAPAASPSDEIKLQSAESIALDDDDVDDDADDSNKKSIGKSNGAADESQQESPSAIVEGNEHGATSEPIAIGPNRGPRQRTDTMNSEWVRLSTSSASTTDTIPMLQATPTSPNEFLSGSNFLESGESFTGKNMIMAAKQDSRGLSCKDGDNSQQDIGETTNMMSRELSSACTIAEASDDSNVSNSARAGMVTPNGEREEDLNNESISSRANLFLMPNDPSLIKFSKSDASLVDSFVLLGDASPRKHTGTSHPLQSGSPSRIQAPPPSPVPGSEPARPQSSSDSYGGRPRMTSTPDRSAGKRFGPGHRRSDTKPNKLSLKLSPNHCWRRELYFRGVLPKRRLKTIPPAITCLTISKDHKNLYVGDAFGKITCWTTN